MAKSRKLLGLAAVGVSLFGVATAYWRRSQTAPRSGRVAVSHASPNAPLHPTVPVSRVQSAPNQPTKYQKEQLEQVRKHEE
jgi:hypothetical protein